MEVVQKDNGINHDGINNNDTNPTPKLQGSVAQTDKQLLGNYFQWTVNFLDLNTCNSETCIKALNKHVLYISTSVWVLCTLNAG